MKWVRTRLNGECGAGKQVYGRCMPLSPHTLIESLGLSIVVPYQRRRTLFRLFSYNSSISSTGPGKGSVYIWESYLVLEVSCNIKFLAKYPFLTIFRYPVESIQAVHLKTSTSIARVLVQTLLTGVETTDWGT